VKKNFHRNFKTIQITFNPIIKNYKTYFKPSKANVLKHENNQNLNGLDCLANYNLSFGTRAIYAIDYDKVEEIRQMAFGGK